MLKKNYDDSCEGCVISKSIHLENGDVIRLNGDWIINHYESKEGFLGWIALQPFYHRMSLDELTDFELKWLGLNIKKIQNLIIKYWTINFPKDPVENVYVVYFFESRFNKPKCNYHLHIHLIPRTKFMDELLREDLENKNLEGTSSRINAWNIPYITKMKQFPNEYRLEKEKTCNLMKWIKKNIQ